MPVITPNQKVNQTKMFGDDFIEVILSGDTYDECAVAAKEYTAEHGMAFIPPFDDFKIIEGQGTVGVEILEELSKVDYLFVPVGGGGLSARWTRFWSYVICRQSKDQRRQPRLPRRRYLVCWRRLATGKNPTRNLNRMPKRLTMRKNSKAEVCGWTMLVRI